MPFTRPILDYGINLLMVRLGFYWETVLKRLEPVPKEEREEIEKKLSVEMGIDEAVAEGLLSRCIFIWDVHDCLVGIKPIPTNRVMRTPGLPAIREIFLKKTPTRKPRRKKQH